MENSPSVSAFEPFPTLVLWGLLGPYGLYALAWLLAVMSRGPSDVTSPWIVTAIVALLVELIAITAAIILVIRDSSRYGSARNVLIAVVAALPILPALFFIIVFSGKPGSFHM